MDSKSIVFKANANEEYFFKEGCYILEYLNHESDSQASIARARVESGCTTRWHKLRNTTERYHILSGEGLAEIANQRYPLTPGDTLVIPANEAQRITNTGTGELVFLAICTPRFRVENYQNMED